MDRIEKHTEQPTELSSYERLMDSVNEGNGRFVCAVPLSWKLSTAFTRTFVRNLNDRLGEDIRVRYVNGTLAISTVIAKKMDMVDVYHRFVDALEAEVGSPLRIPAATYDPSMSLLSPDEIHEIRSEAAALPAPGWTIKNLFLGKHPEDRRAKQQETYEWNMLRHRERVKKSMIFAKHAGTALDRARAILETRVMKSA
jgi:hypothetical protein